MSFVVARSVGMTTFISPHTKKDAENIINVQSEISGSVERKGLRDISRRIIQTPRDLSAPGMAASNLSPTRLAYSNTSEAFTTLRRLPAVSVVRSLPCPLLGDTYTNTVDHLGSRDTGVNTTDVQRHSAPLTW